MLPLSGQVKGEGKEATGACGSAGEETVEARRAQAGNQYDVGTGEHRNAHKGDMNQQGKHRQQIGKETHNQTDPQCR